jgi:hypothetical protein
MLVLGLALPAAADAPRGTLDEARVMALAAASHLEKVGPEAAFADFGNPDDTRWHDRDLYVIAIDGTATVMVHGTQPALNGRPTRSVRDVDGRPFVEEILALPAVGWVRYKWKNPLTNAVEPKASYVVRAGDFQVLVGAYGQ